jgi:hypothetical protein
MGKSMSQPVSIENDDLELEVWPQFGGRVSSVIDKADGFDLLFSYPEELPTRPLYDAPYAASWHAGWDECFPAIAAGPYVGHPYDGISVPEHGELWGLPTTAVPTNNGITTVWSGLRFGYRFTRKLFLDGPSITAQYTLINVAPFPFHFVWAMHAMLAMEQPIELHPPSGEYSFSHDAELKQIDQTFQWPVVAEGEDLSQPESLPPKRGWKSYSTFPIKSPAKIVYPGRGRQLQIQYSSDKGPDAYWGIWVNTGGWASQRQVSIQPTIGRHDPLAAAIRDHSCGTVEPMGRADWSVKMSVGAV